MNPQFSYLTAADFDWTSRCYPLFGLRLTRLAYQQFLEYFKSGLSSFPEFHPENEEDSHICSWYEGGSEAEEDDISDDEGDRNGRGENEERKKSSKKEIKVQQQNCEAENASEFLRNASSVLDTLPGHLGDTLRSRMFAELQHGFTYKKKSVDIKLSVLLSIFGHEDLTNLSITVSELDFFLPEHKVFDMIATRCTNLQELTIDVESITKYHDCEEAYYWKPLEKLTSLESLTLIGAKLPADLDLGLNLKTLNFLKIRGKAFSSYELCAALLRLEFKNVAEVLASWSFSSRNGSNRPSRFTLEELLECAGNEACLQPLCRSLTTFTIDKVAYISFWQPASAAFLLLACPNLENLRTTDTFPFYKALKLLKMRKEASLRTFNLKQLYVMLDNKENLQAMIQATPHCQEVIIQGPSDEDCLKSDYSLESGNIFHQILDVIGEKASALSVTLRSFSDIELDELRALSLVPELRFPDYSMVFVEGDPEENAVTAEKEPVLKHLRKLVLGGCWKDSPSGEANLLEQCPNLEELYFQCIHFCSTGKALVEFASRHWKLLQVLYIKSMEHVEWDADDMVAVFQICSKLRTLVLPHSVLTNSRKEHFAHLHNFAEERGAQVRYASPETCRLFCGTELGDDY